MSFLQIKTNMAAKVLKDRRLKCVWIANHSKKLYLSVPFPVIFIAWISYRNLEYKAYVTIKNRFLGNGSTYLKTPLRWTILKIQPLSFNRMQAVDSLNWGFLPRWRPIANTQSGGSPLWYLCLQVESTLKVNQYYLWYRSFPLPVLITLSVLITVCLDNFKFRFKFIIEFHYIGHFSICIARS